MFWSYSCMLLDFGDILKGLELWFYSCECHPERALLRSTSSFKNVSKRIKELCRQPCPMMGRLAPLMASGKWKEVLHSLADLKVARVIHLSADLGPAETEILKNDFQAGRDRTFAALQLKFAFYDGLPYKLLAVAHPDSLKATDAAAECIAKWHTMSETAQRKSHFLTKFFCKEGLLKTELEVFAMEGVGLERLPLLQSELAKLRFIPIIELNIERLHGVGKQALAGVTWCVAWLCYQPPMRELSESR